MRVNRELNKIGNVYGDLTCKVFTEVKKGKGYYLFECICGNIVEKRGDRVSEKYLQHCGCKGIKKCENRKPYTYSIQEREKALEPKNLTECEIFNLEKTLLISLYKEYIKSASKRDYNWELCIEEFKSIIVQKCKYCNSPPMQIQKHNRKLIVNYEGLLYNGIDRIDNNIGYTSDNVIPCCGWCNRAKGVRKYSEMIMYIERIKSSL